MDDPSLTDQPTDMSATPVDWPYCGCIGQIATHKSGHQNRFYLYSLSAF
jgi:hypothetical protein